MSIDRRSMLGSGAAALASLVVTGRAAAQEGNAAPIDVVAGGGAVETALGTVDFGLVAQVDAGGEVTGTLSVRDMTQPGNPVLLQSAQLNRLEAQDDEPAARELVGWATTGGETTIFVLRVEDLGGPGSGKDTFSLHVGTAAAPFLEDEEQSICDCADYSYSLEGPVVAGDIIVAPQSQR